jgi:hypothetical protein
MRPFRNSGWRYLKTFESIIPVSGAKGRHVFTPTLATAPSTQFDEDEEVELGSTGMGISSGGGESSTIVSHGAGMDVDTEDPISFSKRKASLDNDMDSYISGSSGPPDTASSTSMRPAKKKTSLTSGSKRSSKSRVRNTSKLSAQASTAIAIHDMQGTLNRITDIFEKSTQDPSSAKLDEAIQRLQTTDDGLTMDKKTSVINQFLNKPSVANAYLALTDDALRVNWLRAMLTQIASSKDIN